MANPCIENSSDMRTTQCQLFIERFGPNAAPYEEPTQYRNNFELYTNAVSAQACSEVNNFLTGYTGGIDLRTPIPNRVTDDEDEIGLFDVISRIAAHELYEEAAARINNYKYHLIGFAQEDDVRWQTIEEQAAAILTSDAHNPILVADALRAQLAPYNVVRRDEILEILRMQSKKVLSIQDLKEASWMTEARNSDWIQNSLRWRKHPRIARFIAAVLPH